MRIFTVLFLAQCFLWSVSTASAFERVALVIGNSGYVHVPKLLNPKNDAKGIAKALDALGFKVILGLDLDRHGFVEKTKQFAEILPEAKIAAFYYAGHGLQVAGQNYLVPTDTALLDEVDLDFETIRLDTIMARMEREPKTNLVFLDACRDNPLARNLAARSGTRAMGQTRGLAPVDIGIGTLIAYSTQPGNVAYDGKGQNSPFTAALLRHINTPGTDIALILRDVRQQVLLETNGQQIPWSNSSLTGSVVLKEGLKPDLSKRHLEQEAALWLSIRRSSDPLVFKNFLERFPNGAYSKKARSASEALERQKQQDQAKLSQAIKTAKLQAVELERLQKEKAVLLERFRSDSSIQQSQLDTAIRDSEQKQIALGLLADQNTELQSRIQSVLDNQEQALKFAEDEQKAREREVSLLKKERDLLESQALEQSESQSIALANAIALAEQSTLETNRLRSEKKQIEQMAQERLETRNAELEAARREARLKTIEVERLVAERQLLEAKAEERVRELEQRKKKAEKHAYATPGPEGRKFEDLYPEIYSSSISTEEKQEQQISPKLLASLPSGYQRENVFLSTDDQLPTGKLLLKALQWELNRIGCDAGTIDGTWGNKSRRAIANYHRARGQTKNYLSPNTELLKTLIREKKQVCSATCQPRYVAVNGECVLKKCPVGQWLSNKGQCYRPG